jgi:hypothetical protein
VFQEVEASRLQDILYMQVVRWSALRTGRLYSPGNIPGTHFCQRLSQPQGPSATGKITSMKNSVDTNGNRTCDLRDYSAVLQPTAPPRAPRYCVTNILIKQHYQAFDSAHHSHWLVTDDETSFWAGIYIHTYIYDMVEHLASVGSQIVKTDMVLEIWLLCA